MAFREGDRIPEDEEFTTQELPVTSSVLRAAGLYMAKYCDTQCKEYMLCNAEEKCPVKCLKEGKKVTECGMEFLQKLKLGCGIEFDEFHNCVDKMSCDLSFHPCKGFQNALDQCVKERMDLVRPKIGYYSEVMEHQSDRPKPEVTDPYPRHESLETLPTLKDQKNKTKGYASYFF